MDKSELVKFLDVPGLHGLTTDEKSQVEIFLKTPGKDEFFFFTQLLGKTPGQVRNTMIEEFVRRFDLEAHRDEIAKALPFKRSWLDLDIAIAQFAGSMGADAHLQFWDRMRYIIEALPKRKDYGDKYTDAHKRNIARPKHGWEFATCKHCWRRVAYNPETVRKTASYCFKHNLPATHPLYRKHSRLSRQLLGEQQPVVKKLLALIEECSCEAEVHKTMLASLTTPNDCLPRLVEYLNSAGHNGTPESLLWAFHGPADEITSSTYKDALGEYIQYALNAKDIFDATQSVFIFSIDEMSRAEAWLTLLGRDGRRK